MDFTIGPEESWEKRYGEKFPKEEPKETKPEKKQPKVQKAKKPKTVLGKVDNCVDKSQKIAVEQKEGKERENTSSNMQLEEPKTESENVEKSQETALEETEPQIPGQDNIINHPEYMPKPAEKPADQKESEPKTESEQPPEHENVDTNKIVEK